MDNFDYYKELLPNAQARTKVYLTKIADLTKTIATAQKNLSKEKEAVQSLQDRIEKLKALSSVSLTDDQLSFDKFKTSLKKLTTELDTSQQIVSTFEGEVIPAKENELRDARRNLEITLRSCLMESKPVSEERIRKLLSQTEAERENFISAWRQIYADNGLSFICNSESLLPGSWRAREILEPAPLPDNREAETPESEAVQSPESDELSETGNKAANSDDIRT